MLLIKDKFRILKRAALMRNGFKVVNSYLNPMVIKTNASLEFLN